MFCPNCGNQIQEGAACACQANTQPQTREPAALLCPKCSATVPADAMVCTACGTLVRNSGGPAVKLPENFNVDGITKIAKDISGKAGISVQRLVIAVAALLGVFGCLLPWYGARDSIFGVTFRVSVNAFRTRASAAGISTSEAYILGIIIFILFVGIIALCFLEDKIELLKQHGKFALAGAGGLAFLLAIISFFANVSDLGVRPGVLLVILMSAAIAAAPFIKKLEEL